MVNRPQASGMFRVRRNPRRFQAAKRVTHYGQEAGAGTPSADQDETSGARQYSDCRNFTPKARRRCTCTPGAAVVNHRPVTLSCGMFTHPSLRRVHRERLPTVAAALGVVLMQLLCVACGTVGPTQRSKDVAESSKP